MQLNAGKSEIFFQTATRRDVNQYVTNARPAGLPADQLVDPHGAAGGERRPCPPTTCWSSATTPTCRRRSAAAMVANNMDAFYMGQDRVRPRQPQDAESSTALFRGAWGLNGDFDAIGKTWKWNVNTELGKNEFANLLDERGDRKPGGASRRTR